MESILIFVLKTVLRVNLFYGNLLNFGLCPPNVSKRFLHFFGAALEMGQTLFDQIMCLVKI